MLNIQINTDGVEKALVKFENLLLRASLLQITLKQLQITNIEQPLKFAFIAAQKSKKRHASSFSGQPTSGIPFQIGSMIANNIRTFALGGPNRVFVGTGNLSFMDQNDPIFKLNRPSRLIKSPLVRLWRILEYGAAGPAMILPLGNHLLKWRSPAGKWIASKGVYNHPGQIGKFKAKKIATKVKYSAKGPIGLGILNRLNQIVSVYSFK